MEKNNHASFIFFIVLGESLPRSFYVFDKHLKALGFMLIPVKIDQLQQLVAHSEQQQIIALCSITTVKEMKMYNDKVRGLLKYVLKSKRLTLMHLSSFSKLNDMRNHSMHRNYFFLKYPLNALDLSAKIARYYELKSETNVRWPGGRRAGLGAMA